jgi:hypothetical protein
VLVIVTVSVPVLVVIEIPVPAAIVRVSVAESATTFDWPATAMVAKLSDAVPPDAVAQVLSPLRYVVLSLVPDEPSLKTGTVPDVNCVAFSAVRFTPLAAGSVAGKRALGIVPVVNSVAFNAVIKLPSPLKLVAVSNPTSDILALLTCMIVPVAPS